MNKEIAQAVKSGETISAARAGEYLQRLNIRRVEVQEGIKRTMPSGHDPLIRMGSDRLDAMQDGDAERLKALDDEFYALQAEQTQITYLADRLRDIRKDSETREAVESMPASLKQLGHECDAIVAAHNALEEAWSKANASYDSIVRGRAKGENRNLDVAGAGDTLMRKIGSAVRCHGNSNMLRKSAALPKLFAAELGYTRGKATQAA